MTREDIKKIMPILQAFAEGKTIQSIQSDNSWKDRKELLSSDIEVMNVNPEFYRIKPEPKYRPFRDTEECWQEMLKHQPFGWIYETKCPPPKDGFYMQIAVIGSDIKMNECDEYESFKDAFKIYTFADGQPFGIKVDE